MTLEEMKRAYIDKYHVRHESEIIRNMARWMDDRDEYLNDNKSLNMLLRAFLKYHLAL